MRSRVFALMLLSAALPARAAEESAQALSLATAEPASPAGITATGRVQAAVCARIGARISGHLAEFGKNEQGQMLDAGMAVKAGDVLFRLNETTFRNAVALSEAALNLAQANLDNLTAKTREEKLEQLREVVAELDVRLADRQREEQRFRRLVEVEKTLPVARLEEVQTAVASLQALRKAAQARLKEAENGPTPTEIALAQAQVAQAKAALKIAQDDLRDTAVKAPFDGVITHRYKSPGDYLTSTPHTEVLELVALDKLEAEIRLPEAYFAAVQPVQTQVVLRSPLLKGDLALPIGRVVGAIEKGGFEVRVPIPPDRRAGLVPGMFVTADVALDGKTNGGVIVPLRAIGYDGGKSVVFLADAGKMVRREVELGDRLTEGVIVKSGLAAGQKVVVGPAEALKDGAALPGYLLDSK